MHLDICVVNGPSFGVLNHLEAGKKCLDIAINSIPSGILNLSQLIVLTSKNHNCSHNHSCLHFPNAENVNSDFLCFSFFPESFGFQSFEKKSPISLAGAMAVASVIKRRNLHKFPCKIAFWNGRDSFEEMTLEVRDDQRFSVQLERQNFSPSETILKGWRDKIEEYVYDGLIDESIYDLQDQLQKICPDFHLTLFEQFTNDNSNSLEATFQAVPCIPLNIGEPHCVVPRNIYKFGCKNSNVNIRENLSFIEKLTWKSINDFGFERELHRHFSLFPTLESEVSEYLQHNCGWTFLEGFTESKFYQAIKSEYMTVEPLSHQAPYRNSATGAFASAIAYSKLNPVSEDLVFHFKGRGNNAINRIGKSIFNDFVNNDNFLLVERTDNKWSISSHVAELANFIKIQVNDE